MTRRIRESLNTSFFHVIVQGVNKEYIFKKDYYKEKYLKFLKEAKEEYEIKIISYCVMSNHVHLLVYTQSISNLSMFMKKVNEDYARYYNYKESRVGPVYRDRFLSEPITSQKYLQNCIAYIHNNPVKANLVIKCEDYRYSSYKKFLDDKYFLDVDLIEIIFGNKKFNNEDFKGLHRNKTYYFMEYDYNIENNMQEVIKEFEKRYKKSWKEIIKKNENVDNIIVEIKERMMIPNSKLAKYLCTNRSRVDRVLLKKKCANGV